LKINRKKFVYLISPNQFYKSFYKDLIGLLKTKKIGLFQLRLKNTNFKKKLIIGKNLKKICKQYKVKLIVNDDPLLAKKLGADGCHLGQKDMKIDEARKILKNKIIGITCHNSISLVEKIVPKKPSYIALGAFYASKTKKIKLRAKISLIKSIKKITNIPIVAIGGIKFSNYKKVLLNKADFLAISGYIWNNKKLNPLEALKKLK